MSTLLLFDYPVAVIIFMVLDDPGATGDVKIRYLETVLKKIEERRSSFVSLFIGYSLSYLNNHNDDHF